jgi:hypothetical protein
VHLIDDGQFKTIVYKVALNVNELQGVISGEYLFDNNNDDISGDKNKEQNNHDNGFGIILYNPQTRLPIAYI